MVSILFSVLGCRNNKIYKKDNSDIYPKENFSVVEATFNGKPEIGSFNMAYKNFRDKANFPWCLNLHIELDSKNLYANGLPLPDETKIANKLLKFRTNLTIDKQIVALNYSNIGVETEFIC